MIQDNPEGPPAQDGDETASSTHRDHNSSKPLFPQDKDNSELVPPEVVERMVKQWLDRYQVIDFTNFMEIPFKESEEADKPNPSEDSRINDLRPLPSLEELKKKAAFEAIASRVERAFYLLAGVSIGDYLWTGDVKLLLAVFAFFITLILGLVHGRWNS